MFKIKLLIFSLSIVFPYTTIFRSKATLHGAIRDDNFDEFCQLVQTGADVNAVDADNDTPLHMTACIRVCDYFSILIQNKSDVSDIGYSKRTPLHYAVFNRDATNVF